MLRDVIESHKPSVVVNCAAYTNVDRAEEDFDKCLSVNYHAVKALAELSNKLKFKLIHFSTDYVFNQTIGRPFTESDTTNPINFYGLTKNNGEEKIVNISKKYFIFRIF